MTIYTQKPLSTKERRWTRNITMYADLRTGTPLDHAMRFRGHGVDVCARRGQTRQALKHANAAKRYVLEKGDAFVSEYPDDFPPAPKPWVDPPDPSTVTTLTPMKVMPWIASAALLGQEGKTDEAIAEAEVEEKFGEQNFRVLSEMREKFLYMDPTKSKILVEIE